MKATSYVNDAIIDKTFFNQLNIMVSYVDTIGLCHSVAILREINVMWLTCHVRWVRFHFKRMLITGLGQLNQLNIMVPYVYIIGLCHSVTIL